MTSQILYDQFKKTASRLALLTLVVAVVAIGTVSSGFAADYLIDREPSWVKPVEFSAMAEVPTGDISSGVYYLLSESQTKVHKNGDVSELYHAAIKVVNSSGIKDVSQVSVEFDPEYEQVTLHFIRVHRGQSYADQLSPDKINVLQRESQLEYQIYDGTRSLNIILDDVRVGDIVEYSYTTDGNNPVFDGHYFSSIDTKWSVPVHRVQSRLLWPADRHLYVKNHNTELQPVVNERAGYREYVWQLENVSPLYKDDDTPGWYDPYGWVQLTDMGQWQDVVLWSRNLYKAPDRISPELEHLISEIMSTYADEAERVAAVLRFTQDEVRYMGIEIGPQSHAPSDPSTVFSRRFGDCKDKTLLGLTILRRLGIKADPALVNSRSGETLDTRLPTPTAFNHVILKVVSNDKSYWLDPTISLQRGHLKQIYQPDYGRALVLSEETKDLERMSAPDNQEPTRFIQDTFDLRQGIGAQAVYSIKTIYTARSSDNMRRLFAKNSKQELQKSYLNFYADKYPSIRLDKEMEIEDDEKNNRITVTERYFIPELWEKDEENPSRIEAYFIPQDLRSYLLSPDSPLRTMPFSVSHPINVRQKTLVHLPEKWNIEPGHERVEDPAFLFDVDVRHAGNDLTIDYRYQSRMDHVAAEDVDVFQEHIDQANKQAWFYVSADDPSAVTTTKVVQSPPVEDGLNWPTIVLAIFVFLVAVVAAVTLYFYDPPAKSVLVSELAPNGIGGWLILVAIGIVVQPLMILSSNYEMKWIFLRDHWAALTTPGTESYHVLFAPTLIFELAANTTLVVFAVLLTVLFFQKRSSLPTFYVCFRLAVIFFIVVDSVVGSLIPAVVAQTDISEQSELARQVLFGMIWIAYFLKSERVKATFVRRRADKSAVVQQGDQVVPIYKKVCPLCSDRIVERVATGGPYEGKAFRVCAAYPQCQHLELL